MSCWIIRSAFKYTDGHPDLFMCFLQEAQLARGEAERMASLTGSSSQPLLEDMEDSQEEENLQTQSHHPASHTYRDR